MISAIVTAVRPIYAPLLKLTLSPPHLPEEGAPIRTLKPSEGYLQYQYLAAALIALSSHGVVLVVVTVALVLALGAVGFVIAFVILLFSLAVLGLQWVVVRVDWELTHYLIGERSLRVREGAWVNREVTLSYANVQNVEVVQGPIERLFGFQSLKVTTAGGGAMRKGQEMTGHGAKLVGLENAERLRQLIVQRMKQHRDTGLGDLDEHKHAPAGPTAALPVDSLKQVLDAARTLRDAAVQHAARRGG